MVDAKTVIEQVEKLRALDDTYTAIEKELRQKVAELRRAYQGKFDSIVSERTTMLATPIPDADGSKGTPAIPNFWLDVLANSEEFADDIEEYDEPVLEYLDSLEAKDLDPTDEDKGFVLVFKFKENPFFTNTELRKVYTTARANEFTDQLEIVKIESDKIEWKANQDVTVEAVQKKRSGGGRKKKSGVQLQPRPSFFRYFRDLDQDNIPEDLMGDEEEYEDEEEDEMDELERLQMYMEHDWDKANTLKELIIPRAIRWYTGEAISVEAEEDEDDEDDEEDEDEEEEETPKQGKKALFPAGGANKNPEECKQQ